MQQLSLELPPQRQSVNAMTSPKGYTGLSAFHKYWGKKPIECLGFLIESLTAEDDLIIDPFLGSGLLARECALRKRRFVGIDLNPFAVELSRLMVDLPSLSEYKNAISAIQKRANPLIDETYRLQDGRIATHYLWDHDKLAEVWIAGRRGKQRDVLAPTDFDLAKCASYEGYASKFIRPLRFFSNSRINTTASLTLSDIFTGRALHNIDLLLEHLSSYSEELSRSLLLTLTAAVGQMSKMVFAITGRGKVSGKESSKVEVGSWVIGYWRPPLHFEVNVWNCFARRASKLVSALKDIGSFSSFSLAATPDAVLRREARLALVNDDSLACLSKLPDGSAALILTDPPHSDRVPYLELSELWNAILAKKADFDNEIVVSNARERQKTKLKYNALMEKVMKEAYRVLRPGGLLSVLFNARDEASWLFLSNMEAATAFRFAGSFPMAYSANSVVQDNRRGAMKADYVLLYSKQETTSGRDKLPEGLCGIPGWSTALPDKKG